MPDSYLVDGISDDLLGAIIDFAWNISSYIAEELNVWLGSQSEEEEKMNDTRYLENELAEKRTKVINAYVTQIQTECVSGIMKSIVICEFIEGGNTYTFYSMPVAEKLCLAKGSPIDVWVDPQDWSNYYVSINDYIVWEESVEYIPQMQNSPRFTLVNEQYQGLSQEKQMALVAVYAIYIVIVVSTTLSGKDMMGAIPVILIGLIVTLIMHHIIVGNDRKEVKRREKAVLKSQRPMYIVLLIGFGMSIILNIFNLCIAISIGAYQNILKLCVTILLNLAVVFLVKHKYIDE